MITILTGNVLDTLPTLPANSVQCCVTSPPYWGLRDYGTGTWEGGDAGCDHKKPNADTGHIAHTTLGGGTSTNAAQVGGYRTTCGKCGARRIDSQLGLEPTPQEYVSNMVAVFREVRRVLRDDGVLFLNIGDSYNGSGGAGGDYAAGGLKDGQPKFGGRNVSSLKPKDLCGIPWRVAFALQDDGWWLRSEITWCKRAPMPESVTDRPTSATEKIFLLTKRAQYFYDAQAVAEAATATDVGATGIPFGGTKYPNGNQHSNGGASGIYSGNEYVSTGTRNQRNFWLLGPEPYAEAHFATFPTEIPRRAILAGTSAYGACRTCGAPWERVVERTVYTPEVVLAGVRSVDDSRGDKTRKLNGKSEEWKLAQASAQTTGWQPTCTCDCKDGEREDTVPCVVLDPFTGSGTTGAVARTLGRSFVGIELNPEYVKLAERRIGHAQPALFGL